VNGVKFGETSARSGGGNPELSLRAILASVGWSKRVAIRAKKTNIFEPVIFFVPVDMVKLQRNRLAKPDSVTTMRTTKLKDAFFQKAILKLIGSDRSVVVQVL
jgi:hypothetical protein